MAPNRAGSPLSPPATPLTPSIHLSWRGIMGAQHPLTPARPVPRSGQSMSGCKAALLHPSLPSLGVWPSGASTLQSLAAMEVPSSPTSQGFDTPSSSCISTREVSRRHLRAAGLLAGAPQDLGANLGDQVCSGHRGEDLLTEPLLHNPDLRVQLAESPRCAGGWSWLGPLESETSWATIGGTGWPPRSTGPGHGAAPPAMCLCRVLWEVRAALPQVGPAEGAPCPPLIPGPPELITRSWPREPLLPPQHMS